MRNRKVSTLSKTGIKGVKFDHRKNRFKATIHINQKQIHLGSFHTAKEAAVAYKARAEKYFGEFARASVGEPCE